MYFNLFRHFASFLLRFNGLDDGSKYLFVEHGFGCNSAQQRRLREGRYSAGQALWYPHHPNFPPPSPALYFVIFKLPCDKIMAHSYSFFLQARGSTGYPELVRYPGQIQISLILTSYCHLSTWLRRFPTSCEPSRRTIRRFYYGYLGSAIIDKHMCSSLALQNYEPAVWKKKKKKHDRS